MLSAGRPVAGSVMASMERHVSARYVSRRAVRASPGSSAVADGTVGSASAPAATTAVDARASVVRILMVVPPTRKGRVVGVHLMPVIAMPCMMWRCRSRKTASTGSTTTTEPASRSPYWVAFWPTA